MLLDFRVQSEQRGGQLFDVDNMCEPVFSVVINQLGWLGGRRPNLRWFSAVRSVATTPGCAISIQEEPPPKVRPEGRRLAFSETYTGPLPTKGSAPEIPAWLAAFSDGEGIERNDLAIRLSFARTRLNLGDIATGVVKSTIDCLFPIIGGTVSDPDDWKVSVLQCEKGSGDARSRGVLIEVWASEG
jgi:hypothetical protein